MHPSKPYTSYNLFFIVPFLLWLLVGGVLLFSFDKEVLFRAINLNNSEWGDTLMYYTTKLGEGVFGGLLLFALFIGIKRYRNWWFFSTAIFSNVLPSFIIQAIKSGVGAPRPLKYFEAADWIHILPSWQHVSHRSFPSGHTSAAFCLFAFLAFILPAKYRGWGLLLFLIALLVGYSRVYLAAHFFADVYVGSLIGVGFTMLVFAVMNKYQRSFFGKV